MGRVRESLSNQNIPIAIIIIIILYILSELVKTATCY